MRIHRYFGAALTTLWLFAPVVVCAQVAAPGQSTGPATSNVPVVVSGELPAAMPSDEAPLTNVFQGGVTTGAFFDDNAEIGVTPRQWDLGYRISPNLAFTETMPRLDWGLTYGPGLEISQNLFFRSLFSQNFGGHIDWQMTRHSILSLQQGYVRGTDPFQQLGTNPGPLISPNPSLYAPSLLETSILSHALYSYQFSPHSSMGIGGSFNRQEESAIPHTGPSTELVTGETSSGEAYISHSFTASNQFGFQYGFQSLQFPREDARTTTQTFLVFDQMSLGQNTTLSLYAGPEYSQTFNQVQLNLLFLVITIPVRADQWDYAAGAIYTWTGRRVGMNLDYSRRISDGGGFVGAVKLNAGTARFNLHLSQSWSMSATLSAADDQLLAVNNGASELLSYSAGVGLSRRLSRNFSMDFNYGRLNQTGGLAGFPIGNRDFAGASLHYHFMKPLGR